MSKTTIPTGGITDATIATGDIADDAVTVAKATGFGKVGQIIYGQHATQVSSASNSYVDTGITANITPTATNSTIIIFGCIMGLQSAGATNARMDFQLLRGSTGVATSGANMWDQSGNVTIRNGGFSFNMTDSPNSTSQQTYKFQFKAVEGTCEVQRDGNSGASSITLVEVLA
jgi:hypothetical protein